MVKANELRIGNWLWYENDTYVDRKNKVHDNWFQVAYIGETIGLDIGFEATQRFEKNPLWSPKIDKLKPIPLTPELLEKCGFTDDDGDFLLQINKDDCLHINLQKKRTLIEGFTNWMVLPNIEYLHELQNWWFTHTKIELKITL